MRKDVLIIGAGVAGQGIARFLEQEGLAYYFVDDDPDCDLADFRESSSVPWSEITYTVVSAGVGLKSLWLRAVEQQGISIIGEAQFALERMKSRRFVGVTGTNGKTTLVLFVEYILRESGFDAKACGNVGLSLGDFLCSPSEIGIVELSSFQLERLSVPVFEAVVVLDITPDHLDRHSTMEVYAKTKIRLCSLIRTGGSVWVAEGIKKHFGSFVPDHAKIICERKVAGLLSRERFFVSSAFCLVENFGVSFEEVLAYFQSFKRPDHRLEKIGVFDEVRYINDSKATNFAAVKCAINWFAGSDIVLIMTGRPKESSIDILSPDLKSTQHILVFGEMAPLLKDIGEEVANLQEAVSRARACAKPGGVILFSPGGSSFDCFENYVDRGLQFKYTVDEAVKLEKEMR